MEQTYKRYEFSDIFNELPDGSLSPNVPIEINGITFGPGVTFQKGVIFGGIDFHLFKGRGIAVYDEGEDTDSGTLKIAGFY